MLPMHGSIVVFNILGTFSGIFINVFVYLVGDVSFLILFAEEHSSTGLFPLRRMMGRGITDSLDNYLFFIVLANTYLQKTCCSTAKNHNP